MSIKQPPHQPEESSTSGRQGSIVKHPEIVAISRISSLLEPLDAVARRRVLDYLYDLYLAPESPAEHPSIKVVP